MWSSEVAGDHRWWCGGEVFCLLVYYITVANNKKEGMKCRTKCACLSLRAQRSGPRSTDDEILSGQL